MLVLWSIGPWFVAWSLLRLFTLEPALKDWSMLKASSQSVALGRATVAEDD